MLKNPLILALDVDDFDKCVSLAKELASQVGAFKVGPRLILTYGNRISKTLADIAPLFIDHKFLDIPSTMIASVQAAFDSGATLCTVHAWSGEQALSHLAELEKTLNKKRPFKILVVTILTSFTENSLPAGVVKRPIQEHVEDLVQQSQKSGLSGIVCSPQEVGSIKTKFRETFVVTPGIRFSEMSDDQSRVATPQQALFLGADAFVVGRPILNSKDPLQACRDILKSIQL